MFYIIRIYFFKFEKNKIRKKYKRKNANKIKIKFKYYCETNQYVFYKKFNYIVFI